jgi:uncharacterized membrane protein
MTWLMIVLRVLHIGGGVFWAGGTFVFASYVEPTTAALGPEGGRFMQRLAGSRYPIAMSVSGILTIVAGVWLLAIDSGGFQPAFMGTGTGVALSIGGLAGLAAAVVGLGVQGRNAMRMGALAMAIDAQKGVPTAEQTAQVQALRGKLRSGGRWTARLLGIAVVCMAVARYV